MARPVKTTVDYFPHNSSHGRTVYIIKQKWGNDGYAVWFQLLERLGVTEGHFIDCRDSATFIHMSAYCGVTESLMLEILDTLAELGAIDRELWQQQVIYCQNFVDGVTDAYYRRLNRLPTRQKVFDYLAGLIPTETPLSEVYDNRNPVKLEKTREREKDREKDSEKDSEKEKERKTLSSSTSLDEGSVLTATKMTITDVRFLYQETFGQNMPGGCNHTANEICQRFSSDGIRQAFEAAAVHNKPNMAYVLGVLNGGNKRNGARASPVKSENRRENERREASQRVLERIEYGKQTEDGSAFEAGRGLRCSV